MHHEALDELLERIWVEEEHRQANPGGSSPEIAMQAGPELLQALGQEGLISREGETVRLTQSGRQRAGGIIRSHRIAERLLKDILNMEEARSENEACTFEHNLTPGIVDSICTLLGHPQQCPHGNSIPEGECCRQDRDSVGAIVTTLTNLRLGERAVVAYLTSSKFNRIKKLYAFGILPGVEVELMQLSPAYVLKVEETQLALEREVAESIFVRRRDSLTAQPTGD